jgi:hypothetical protein
MSARIRIPWHTKLIWWFIDLSVKLHLCKPRKWTWQELPGKGYANLQALIETRFNDANLTIKYQPMKEDK